MPISCSARTCVSRYNQKDEQRRAFHKFPLKNPELLKKWVKAAGREGWTPTKYSNLCGDHFTDDCYYVKSRSKAYGEKYLRLKPDAVPTIFNETRFTKKKGRPPKNNQMKLKIKCRSSKDPDITYNQGSSQWSEQGPSSSTKVKAEPKVDPLEVLAVILDKKENEECLVPVNCMKVKIEEEEVASDNDIDYLPVSDEEKMEVFNEDEDDAHVHVDTDSKQCRICGSFKNECVGIFDTEGKSKKLLEKMKQHLPIQPPQEFELLPKFVCKDCVQRLETCNELAELAIRTDRSLRYQESSDERGRNVRESLRPKKYTKYDTESGASDCHSDFEWPDEYGRFDEDYEPKKKKRKKISHDSDSTDNASSSQVKKKKVKKSSKGEPGVKSVRNFTPKVQIICGICDKLCESSKTIKQHYVLVHAKHLCEICYIWYDSEEDLKDHYNESHQTYCPFCPDLAIDCHQIKKHINTVHKQNIPKFIKLEYPIKDITNCKICREKQTSNFKAKHHYFFEHYRYACDICLEIFNISESQVEHTSQVHMIPCQFCAKKYYCYYEFKNHQLSEHQEQNSELQRKIPKSPSQIFECKTCHKGLMSKVYIKRHNYWSHKLYTCDFCSEEFKARSEEEAHFNEKHTECCHFCEEILVDTDINTHLQTVHSTINAFTCENCGEIFSDRNEFITHRQIHKAVEDMTFFCDECGTELRSQPALITHKKRRHEGRDKLCHLCSKSFAFKCELNKHIKTHTKRKTRTKAYPCTDCDRSFINSRNLIRHMTRHNKKLMMKEFTCTICNESFQKKINLRKHERTMHSSLTVYTCALCKQTYSTEDNVISHLSFHKPSELARIKDPYIKTEAMKCDTCGHFFSCKITLTNHILSHLTTKLKLKRIDKLSQIFFYCKAKEAYQEQHKRVELWNKLKNDTPFNLKKGNF